MSHDMGSPTQRHRRLFTEFSVLSSYHLLSPLKTNIRSIDPVLKAFTLYHVTTWYHFISEGCVSGMILFSNCCGCSRRKKKRDIFTENQNGIPRYKSVVRSQCPLLQACWDQDWDAALRRLKAAPWETFYKTQNSGRSALHLSTIPSVASPSIELLNKLIEINPHAVLVLDSHTKGCTPIHFICGNIATRENTSLVRFFVETALKEHEKALDSVYVHSGSPLYLASKRGAPAETLDVLVQTKRVVPWIAPWTGTETIEESQLIHCDGNDSPLVALWSKTCQDIPEFPSVNDTLLLEMKEIVHTVLGCDVDSKPKWSVCSSNRSSVLEAWERIVTLFGNPCLVATSSTMLHRVSNLYSPVPDLVSLVCRLFPEQVLEEVSVSSSCPEIPLHAVLRHTWSGIAADSIRDIIRTLVTAQPESLMRVNGSTSLYTVFLAASRNSSYDILFDMLRLSPHALQLQRIAYSI